ncbi:fasciclin domain-containing protein [Brevundimonas sp.]|uniref:fasciclin domain-containing protein n=1 Tax=Brevundimonas sp. TaxID=1871086 RepID=UPI001D4547C4|nr:fasciclin domain-containing protein [Brevundimonas sp.]MBL0948488.1 fasciclin domain-containing protein [Brevundimonas sp.]
MLKTAMMSAVATVALVAAGPALAQEATPPTTPPAETMPMTPQEAAEAPSVTEVLRNDGRFTTLLAALEQAELTSVLESQAAVSIFAPTDDAFAALPEADRARLMDPANVGELRELLLYHVIAADVASDQILGTRGGVPTAAGAQVQFDGTGDAIRVDAATVVEGDIQTANGTVFAIDTVLNPAASQAAMGDEDVAQPVQPEPVEATPPTLPDDPVDEAMEPNDPLPTTPE